MNPTQNYERVAISTIIKIETFAGVAQLFIAWIRIDHQDPLCKLCREGLCCWYLMEVSQHRCLNSI